MIVFLILLMIGITAILAVKARRLRKTDLSRGAPIFRKCVALLPPAYAGGLGGMLLLAAAADMKGTMLRGDSAVGNHQDFQHISVDE